MKEYVVGFLFNAKPKGRSVPPGTTVLLIKKTHPDWAKGKYAGVGGSVEFGESIEAAMSREFEEETGLYIPKWERFVEYIGTRDNEQYKLHFFRAFSVKIYRAKSTTEEKVERCSTYALPVECIPNLRWLIPMALSMDREYAAAFSIVEEGSRV